MKKTKLSAISFVLLCALFLGGCEEKPGHEIKPVFSEEIPLREREVLTEPVEVPIGVLEEAVAPPVEKKSSPPEPKIKIEPAPEPKPVEIISEVPVADPVGTLEVRQTVSTEVTYATPKGNTELKVELVLEDNKIVAVDLAGNPKHRTSLEYQSLFEAELGSLVLGKAIAEVTIPSKVNGSSLTPGGFRKALERL
jgi:PBP1b-binding outer membrane lipoprotein LpoB